MFAFNDYFSPFDDLYRLRRQMNDVFSDFDRTFGQPDPLLRDPFFATDSLQPQLRLEHTNKDTKAEEKYGAGGTEQKADSNAMNVESTSSGGAKDSLTQHNQNVTTTVGRPRNAWLAPWARIQMPKCDVVENPENYVVTCDLPGMAKEDVKLSVNDHGMLVIHAERSSQAEQKDPQAKYHRVERHYGKFERTLPVPKNVELERVTAKHENGQLKIQLPKKSQSKVDAANKLIQIQ